MTGATSGATIHGSALGRRGARLGGARGARSRSRFSRPRWTRSEVGAGTRLLDAGCGAGLALALAAQRGAVVTGLDASAGLLAVARERLPEADLREGDLEAAALRRRQLRRRHRIQLRAVRGRPDRGAARDQARREAGRARRRRDLGQRPSSARCGPCWVRSAHCCRRPAAARAGPSRWPRPGALEALVESAGLMRRARDRRADALRAPRSRDRRCGAHLASGPARRAIQTVGFAATRKRSPRACEASRRPDGSVTFDNVFKVLIARA